MDPRVKPEDLTYHRVAEPMQKVGQGLGEPES